MNLDADNLFGNIRLKYVTSREGAMWVVKFSAPGSRQEESLVIHSVLASSNDATLGRVAVQKPVAEVIENPEDELMGLVTYSLTWTTPAATGGACRLFTVRRSSMPGFGDEGGEGDEGDDEV